MFHCFSNSSSVNRVCYSKRFELKSYDLVISTGLCVGGEDVHKVRT